MISQQAITEFMEIWRDEIGASISQDQAAEQAVALLSIYRTIYKPIKKAWEYENGNKHTANQTDATASGAQENQVLR